MLFKRVKVLDSVRNFYGKGVKRVLYSHEFVSVLLYIYILSFGVRVNPWYTGTVAAVAG